MACRVLHQVDRCKGKGLQIFVWMLAIAEVLPREWHLHFLASFLPSILHSLVPSLFAPAVVAALAPLWRPAQFGTVTAPIGTLPTPFYYGVFQMMAGRRTRPAGWGFIEE